MYFLIRLMNLPESYNYKSVEKLEILFIGDKKFKGKSFKTNIKTVEGLKPSFTMSAEESLESLENNEFDAVIMGSCEISGQSSTILLSKIREKFPKIPCIVFIDEEYDKMEYNGKKESFDDFLLKSEGVEKIGFLEERIRNIVKNKKADQAAKRILERVTDGFAEINNKDNFTFVNDEACRILQKSREDLIGNNVWEEFPKILGTQFQEKYQEAMDNKQAVYLEEYHPPLSSWLAIKAFPSDSGLTVYLRDITDRKKKEKRIERTIKAQEATTDLLRMALEEKDLVQIEHEALEKVSNALNLDYGRIWRLKRRSDHLELAAQKDMNMPDIEESSLNLDLNAQETYSFTSKESIAVEDYKREMEFERTKLMNFMDIRSGITVVIGEYSYPKGVLSIFSRSEREFSEDEIKFVEGIANVVAAAGDYNQKFLELSTYRKAVDTVPHSIFLADSNKRLIMVNESFKEMTGYRSKQIIGRRYDNFITEDEKGFYIVENINGDTMKTEGIFQPIEMPNGIEGEIVVLDKDLE